MEGTDSHSGLQMAPERRLAEDDEIAETDPEGRYYRYKDSVGKGRFKEVYKAFNSQIGIDVAWSKVSAESNNLTEPQLHDVAEDMKTGLELDHPNIIKCFKCWEDREHACINLITELFTSGNLRQYRNLHKHLDLKAVKRMAKQILKGLGYLHNMEPAVTHGDLRCDKIYVNGHTGEIKIGDLGLATLLPFRWEDHTPHSGGFNPTADIFAFGLCMLELITLRQLDPQHCDSWEQLLAEVQDEEARVFIGKCLGVAELRPTADELLADPFLYLKKPTDKPELKGGDDPLNNSNRSIHFSLNDTAEKRKTDENGTLHAGDQSPGSDTNITVGTLKGEDFEFAFKAENVEGQMHFKLLMKSVQKEEDGETPQLKREIEFVFDPEVDTADALAAELSQQFNLSPTDTEICAAALKEYLARELGGEGRDNGM